MTEFATAADGTAIAYEAIRCNDGSAPVLRPMSQIAGRMSAHIAASLLQNNHGGRGVLGVDDHGGNVGRFGRDVRLRHRMG